MSALFLKVAITLCQLFTLLWILGGQLNMVTIQQWPKWLMVLLFAAITRKLKRLIKTAKFFQFSDFIEKLPGYSAQNLTLDGMIYFLIVIAAFIIGIFIFVMTLQENSNVRCLKVQGVPTSFLAKAVMLQKPLYWLF